jgi:hypothetical protein
MTVRRHVARAIATALGALIVLVAALQGTAFAAAPALTIYQPVSGPTSQQTPTFAGTTTDAVEPITNAFDPITLYIYAETNTTGTPVQSWTVFAPSAPETFGDLWEITPESPLGEGEYTAVARQTNSESETGSSNPVTFTVQTTPVVTLTSPEEDAVLGTANPTLSGGAGAAPWDGPVKVVIYEGSLGGRTVTSGNASMDEGSWFYAPHLRDGVYTAQASQGNEVGHTGTSGAVTFTVDATAPVVTLTSPGGGAVLDTSEPTLSGDAATAAWDDSSVTVKIHQGDSLSGTLEASGIVPVSGGQWSYAPDLSDGVYTAQASQGDEAHHTGTSGAVTFTVDANPPVVTLTSPAEGFLFPSSSQSLSGAAATAAWDDSSVTVAIYQGDSVLGKREALGSVSVSGGKWSYGSHLSTGEYTAQASQTDQADHTGTSAAVTFTVDATAPVVTLTSPTGGALLDTATPTLSGEAGAGEWDEQHVTLAIHEGGSLTGELVGQPSVPVTDGRWSYSVPELSKLSNGIYTAQASQGDAASHTGTSTAITFTVDATAPEVTLNSLGTYVKTSEPRLSGDAGAAPWDERGVTVEIHHGTSFLGGSFAASGTVSESSGKWSYPSSHLSDGTYTAEAYQTDKEAHTGESSPVTFTVDTAKPALTLQSPTENQLLHTSRPTFSGAAGTAPGDLPVVTLKIYKGSAVSGSPNQTLEVTPVGAAWTTGTALSNGTYTVLAEQSDEAGNREEHKATFTIETNSPTVTLTSGFETISGHVLAGATPTFGGGAGTEEQDSTTISVKVYKGTAASGTAWRTVTGTRSGAKWTAGPVEALEDGVYTAVAEQTDSNTFAETGVSAAVTFTVDTTAPTVTLTSPKEGAFVKTATPTLSGGGGAAAWDEAVTVEIHKGESLTGSVVASGSVTVSAGTWSYSVPKLSELSEGIYTAQASQKDEAGHTGTSSAVTFTVATALPAVTLTSPANREDVHVSQPTFKGLAGDAPGDEPSVTLNIYEVEDGIETLIQTVTGLTPNGKHEWTTGSTGPRLQNGIYLAVAEQANKAGNVGKSKASFTIETRSPEVTLDSSGFVQRGTELLTGPTPSFSGSAATEPEDVKAVTVKIYSGTSTSGSPLSTITVPLSGTRWNAGPAAALQDGTYTVQAEQTDKNTLSQPGVSNTITFTVDADAPQVTLTSPANGSSSSSSSQTLSGAAGANEGDLPGITVQLYTGSSITGQAPLQSVGVQASGGAWSAVFGGLTPGTYTAQAEQSDDVGNIGRSGPVTFTVLTPPIIPAAAPPPPPLAAFKWAPADPRTNEPVTLASSSTDGGSAIKSFSWALTGNGVFAQGESVVTTSFTTAGAHVIQLRVTDALGRSSTVAETIPVTSAPLPLMQPFPVVRMSGSFNASGANITLLAALAPVGAHITITCRGKGCPTKSQGFVATTGAKNKSGTMQITFRRFERFLRRGVVLEVWISKPGQIGKFTRFTIRRGKSPTRLDQCLNPAGTVPLVCPS